MGKGGSKLAVKEHRCLTETHNLSEAQFDKIYADFTARAGKKKFLNFKDFLALYSGSRFEHNLSDQLALFRTITKSDRLNLSGFVRLCQLSQSAGSGQDAERMRVMDEDNSGSISEDEFYRFLTNFVDDETTMQNFFDRADEDRSKLIDFHEFASFCRKHGRAYRLMCAYVFPQV